MFTGVNVAHSPALVAGITSAVSTAVCFSRRFYYCNCINRDKTRYKVNKQQEDIKSLQLSERALYILHCQLKAGKCISLVTHLFYE